MSNTTKIEKTLLYNKHFRWLKHWKKKGYTLISNKPSINKGKCFVTLKMQKVN